MKAKLNAMTKQLQVGPLTALTPPWDPNMTRPLARHPPKIDSQRHGVTQT